MPADMIINDDLIGLVLFIGALFGTLVVDLPKA